MENERVEVIKVKVKINKLHFSLRNTKTVNVFITDPDVEFNDEDNERYVTSVAVPLKHPEYLIKADVQVLEGNMIVGSIFTDGINHYIAINDIDLHGKDFCPLDKFHVPDVLVFISNVYKEN